MITQTKTALAATVLLLILWVGKIMAMPATYVVKIPIADTGKTVPISLEVWKRAMRNSIPAEDDINHLLQWVLQDAFNSTNPLHHSELSLHIALIKNSLKGHVALFDAEFLAMGYRQPRCA